MLVNASETYVKEDRGALTLQSGFCVIEATISISEEVPDIQCIGGFPYPIRMAVTTRVITLRSKPDESAQSEVQRREVTMNTLPHCCSILSLVNIL